MHKYFFCISIICGINGIFAEQSETERDCLSDGICKDSSEQSNNASINAHPRGDPLLMTLTQFDKFCIAIHSVYKRTKAE